jgi:hypothetical protein
MIFGTVTNGTIVLEHPQQLPEGARVRVQLVNEPDSNDWAVIPPTESYEQHLETLRQSLADTASNVGGEEMRAFLRDLAIHHEFPLQPGE